MTHDKAHAEAVEALRKVAEESETKYVGVQREHLMVLESMRAGAEKGGAVVYVDREQLLEALGGGKKATKKDKHDESH